MATEIPATLRRYAVRLKKDGTYRVETYTDPRDYTKFTTLAAGWHIAAEHKGAWIELAEVA